MTDPESVNPAQGCNVQFVIQSFLVNAVCVVVICVETFLQFIFQAEEQKTFRV